jgi:hypothetical protein
MGWLRCPSAARPRVTDTNRTQKRQDALAPMTSEPGTSAFGLLRFGKQYQARSGPALEEEVSQLVLIVVERLVGFPRSLRRKVFSTEFVQFVETADEIPLESELRPFHEVAEGHRVVRDCHSSLPRDIQVLAGNHDGVQQHELRRVRRPRGAVHDEVVAAGPAPTLLTSTPSCSGGGFREALGRPGSRRGASVSVVGGR